jgi:serine/threonine-protein kinase
MAAELKTLGRYNIERVLGKGAMGVVYEGLDPRLGRRVAIKTILKSHLDEDTAKDYSMRFVREAQAVARLNHPNIVQVYDFGEEGDIAYLVMEFIKGKELKNFFDANERFDLKEAVRIMCELCDALDFAHQAGIVHRDIKPANVMLDHQARTKLTDFGVARVTDSDKTSVERTQAGTMVGTPAYMSPEQITGGNIDRRTDVFSAGIILYQFLTGEKPFTGSGAWTIAKKIIQEEPPLPSSLNNAVTPLFDAVVNKALAKNPDNRYQSARDLAVALRRALEGKPEEDDADKTIVGAITEHIAPAPSRPAPAPRQEAARSGAAPATTQAGNQEVELEFWRAIKDGNDPEDFELYVQQFPTGIYAALAKRKIAKLRGVTPEETGAKAREQEKKEAEEAAKRETEARAKLAEEKDKLEAELKRKEEEYRKREAEAEAKRLAEEKGRAEAEARREAEAKARAEAARQEAEQAKQEALAAAKAEAEKARREAEEKARLAAEQAKKEAAAERERARLEAEKAKQEAERAKQEALAAAKAEAEKARREAEEKARQEAEKARKEAAAERERVRLEAEKAKREAEEKARKEVEARAKKDAEERAKREAEFKKREAELKAQAAAGGKKSSPVLPVVVGVIVLALAGVGYFFLPKEDPQAAAKLQAMQKQLEEAKQKAAELQAQKQKEEQARIALENARKAEEEARKAGDLKRQQEFAQARARAEVDAKREADATKLREAEAKKTADAAEAARKQADTKKQAAEAKAAADKLAQEKALAEKLAKERAAFAVERERLAAEKAAAEKAAADARAAAEKAAAERAAAEKAKQQVAAAAVQSPAAVSSDALLKQAEALESEGKGKEAVKVYTRAARSGNGKAAKRLGEIYDKGLAGIPRDYAESLKWYNAARVLGEDVPLARGR